jgi:REP element-mobilizing transposase RayT
VRTKRIKEPGEAYYHVISRVVDRRFVFTDDEKERYCQLLRKVEAFSGVRVLTHSAMDNHTHELLHVPERRPVSEEEVIERMAHLYPPKEVRKTTQLLRALRQSGNATAAEAVLETFRLRMFNLSEFEKTLKQRITQSYNRRQASIRPTLHARSRLGRSLHRTPTPARADYALALSRRTQHCGILPANGTTLRHSCHFRHSSCYSAKK